MRGRGQFGANFRFAGSNHPGVIENSERGQHSGPATPGTIRYRLKPKWGAATQVELDVGYGSTGPLAQFNPSGLVHDIASRIIATPTQSVEVCLSGNAASLFLNVLVNRIKASLHGLFGHGLAPDSR